MEMPFFSKQVNQETKATKLSPWIHPANSGDSTFFRCRGFEGAKKIGVFFVSRKKTQGETRGGKFGKLLCPQVFFGKVAMAGTNFVQFQSCQSC